MLTLKPLMVCGGQISTVVPAVSAASAEHLETMAEFL